MRLYKVLQKEIEKRLRKFEPSFFQCIRASDNWATVGQLWLMGIVIVCLLFTVTSVNTHKTVVTKAFFMNL